MATEPSLKGSVITELIEDINKLITGGELSRESVERQLTSEDTATLETGIVVSQWYSVQFYRRAAELLRDTVGGGRNEYLRERGLTKGRKLIEAGLYQQMEYASRAQVKEEVSPDKRFAAYGHDLRLFVSLSRSLLNFTKWSTIPDPDHEDRYLILVEEAAGYPDALAWATEGLIESMASTHGLSNVWSHQRTQPDRIVFRMSRPA
jgi:hypothetical protein